MDPSATLRLSDAAVVARYLQLRTLFHDRLLARVEVLAQDRYDVQLTGRIPATLVALVRKGFARPGEGEVWPVCFLTPVDITLALCVQISNERLANLGTVVEGPQRIRHRHWEDWWGWETNLDALHPTFFGLPAAGQEQAVLAWFAAKLEWLAHNGLLRKK